MTSVHSRKPVTRSARRQVIIFSMIFSVLAVLVLIAVRATGSTISIGAGAKLDGAVSYKTDDDQANGNYLSFGEPGTDSDGLVPFTPADMPAYPAVPAISPPKVTRVTNYSGLRSALDNNAVETIVLADGNYALSGNKITISRIKNKTIMAENKHKATVAHSPSSRNEGIYIANSENIRIVGIAFSYIQDYAIKVGCQDGSCPAGPNQNVVIEHNAVLESGRSGFNANNGWGSSCTAGEGISRNITFQYNEFYKLGMRFTSNSSLPYHAQLSEGIYIGSGGNCQEKDTTYDVKIVSNYFDGTGMVGMGEAIGAKTNSRDLLIENNYIKNWQLGFWTDHGAIGAWFDGGLPIANRDNFTAGEKGIVIRGNVIDGVKLSPRANDAIMRPDIESSDVTPALARGITVGHQALVENNTIKNTDGAAIGIVLHGLKDPPRDNRIIWGFSNTKETTVTIRGNTGENNNGGMLGATYQKAEFPLTVKASGNSPEVVPFPAASNVIFSID